MALVAIAATGCGGGDGRSTATATTAPVTTPRVTTPNWSHLQNIGAPGEPEAVWGSPTNGSTPRGVLMLIHGGSWIGLSQSQFESMRATAPVFQNLGLETLTVDYRHGAQGITDVRNLYLDARRQVGPTVPICAAGVSAGAHIAMMLAISEPDLACVLDLAGPTDLPAFATQPGGTALYRVIQTTFSGAQLEQLSPERHAGSIRAKLLMIYAQNDPLVPVAQGEEMKRADPAAQLIVLPPGSSFFVHTGVDGVPVKDSGVSASAYAAAQKQEVSFLEAATARH